MHLSECVIEETIFRNDENGYSVISIKNDKTSFTAVGIMPTLAQGEVVNIEGEWIEHPVYGRQLKIIRLEIRQPDSVLGIEKYLASGLIRGVKIPTARLIVKYFGHETLNILSENPERLLEIPGIGEKRAKMIAESYHEQVQQRDIMLFMQQYGITANHSVKIINKYGANAKSVIKQNPYKLVEDIEGIGFRTADKIAESLGISRDSDFRIFAGIKYVLNDAVNSNGHCFLTREELIKSVTMVLLLSREKIEVGIDSLILTHQIVAEFLSDNDNRERICVYPVFMWMAEKQTANLLIKLSAEELPIIDTDFEERITLMEIKEGIQFHKQQRSAVRTAVTSGLSIITGGPGTGKTTIIKCIIDLLSDFGEVLLAAPTGRAAKRMSESCGIEAKTIHRLLEYNGEKDTFYRNEEHPLDASAIIIDEMSMVDIQMMYSILKAIQPGTRLILVGDSDQLPSVGAGNVLTDLLDSGIFPVTRLTEIFRQDEKSMIVVNAHRINQGESPILNKKGSDFFYKKTLTAREAVETIVDMCVNRIPNYLGCSFVDNIQVLAPTKKGECGVHALNSLIQNAFNPASEKKDELIRGSTVFRKGDKIMQMRNNYQMEWTRDSGFDIEEGQGVYNGDIGFVREIDTDNRYITVEFDDQRLAEYGPNDLEDLELAYCISIHKSQGSEFPVVIIPVTGGPAMLLTRNLFYTGVTRAKKMVLLVGRESIISQMISNNSIKQRNSYLNRRLIELSCRDSQN